MKTIPCTGLTSTNRLLVSLTLSAALMTGSPAGIIEGEALSFHPDQGEARPQGMGWFKDGKWSGDSQLWWKDAQPGATLVLTIPVKVAGTYRLGAGFTKAPDYGVFDFALDGKPLAEAIDFFAGKVTHTGTVPLGEAVELSAGDHRLEITVKGANAAAKKAYMLGLDYLVLAPGDASDLASFGPKMDSPKPAAPEQSDLKFGNELDAEARTPAAQQAGFTVPEGFTIELVASEETGLPKPVMAAFDDAGRLWSVTATEYPRDNDPEIWTRPGNDRVVVIDTPCAPGPQTARTFAEGMVMPLSVLPYGDGAFVAQGPELLYLEDKDRDGTADGRRVLAQGFGVQDTHTMPHQLTQMPGHRIVYSQGVLTHGKMVDAAGKAFAFDRTLVASMAPDGTGTRILSAGLNNIWCWAVSRTGRVFIHEANDLGYSLVPFEEDTTYPSFKATKLHPDAPLHPPTAQGLDLGGTGFSGLALCDDKSGSFPDPWHGLMFVANPITGTINSVRMTLGEQGVWDFEKQPDLVTCDDPMFRPIAITFGPDGCLYITDWYNRIISHNEVDRNHPGRDKSRGRIWRVRHKSQVRAEIPDMTKIPTAELPSRLGADSTWQMRAAWHQIGQRQATELIPALEEIVVDTDAATDMRIHALWSLEDLGHFDKELWAPLISSTSTDLRREAVRALSSLRVPEETAFALLQPLADEPEWTVRYEVLRYFRRAPGPVNPEHVAWLRRWSADPAPQNMVEGWKGKYLALDGSYQRAFQDFLLELAATKSPAAVLTESEWDKTLATVPAPTAEVIDQLAKRQEAVKAILPSGDPAAGKPLVASLCLGCHSLAGEGIGFGPPLDGSGDRDIDGLIAAILDPDQAAENVFRLYRITTKDGKTLEGFKASESATALTLQYMGGNTQDVPIDDIASAGYIDGRSVMPPLAANLSDEQVADLIAYLRSR